MEEKIKETRLVKLLNISYVRNLTIIFVLGIASGLPLALLLSTLKAFLYEKGFSIELIGLLTAVSLPYSIKFLFAPVLDSLRIPILTKLFGFRKSWLLAIQICLAICIFFIGIFGELKNLPLLILFASLTAFFSACQDIVIDGYRIELFEKRDQGLAVSFYIFGYRFGLLISGAMALYLAHTLGWQQVFLVMSVVTATCAAIFNIAGSETKKNFKSQTKNFRQWFCEFVINPFKDFAKNNKYITILILIVSFKLGDAYAGSLTVPFLLEMKYTKLQIAAIVKTFGLFATLFGVLIGGLIIKKIGIFKCLCVASVLQMLSNLAFAYLANTSNSATSLYLVIFAENFSGGIGDAVFVAYLSSLCNIKFSATQYAILTSLASVSRSLLATSSGLIVANIGWYSFFIFSTFLSIPTFVCLYVIFKSSKKNV